MPLSKRHRDKGIPRKKTQLLKKPAKPLKYGVKRKKAHKDIEATWTKNRGKTHYGYKVHVMSDEESKIIENYETTTASTHDRNV